MKIVLYCFIYSILFLKIYKNKIRKLCFAPFLNYFIQLFIFNYNTLKNKIEF